MESSGVASSFPQNSRKRVFWGSSSSGADLEVIEIAPPLVDRTSNVNVKGKGKQKEVAYHEIIDVDLDEDCDDVVLLDGNFESNKKAKVGMGTSLGSSKKVASNKKGKEVQVDPGHSLNGFNPGSNNFFDLDDYVFDDEYGTLQSHFNDKGLSTGIPFVTSNAQFEASVSQPNRVDPMPASTMFSSSKKSTPVRGRSTYSTQIGSHNYLSNNSYTLNDMLLDQDATVNGSSSKRSRSVKSSSRKAKLVDNDVKNKYESFKRFDSVADHSGHHYARQSSASAQPPKNWAKKIQEEWKILEKDLPDTIFVRVYESRMDLLRAVIIGAEGTPYHDGLFFFDVFFPSTYPNTPPLVHYHSGGLRINPNLYNCGKVCLSLLNTWSGGQNEKWVPGKSTMLQVLVSIQGLILNMKPYFNEPGHAYSNGSVYGEKSSLQYNENTFILSLKTMVYTMKKPPKYFEDLVIGHFQHRVRDILMACKAYTEGVQVGCVVKGGVQDVDEDNSSCSDRFKHDVVSYIKTLVAAFKKIGAKEAEEFLSLSVKETPLPAAPALGPSLIPAAHSYSSHGYIPYPKPSVSTAYKHAAYKQHW